MDELEIYKKGNKILSEAMKVASDRMYTVGHRMRIMAKATKEYNELMSQLAESKTPKKKSKKKVTKKTEKTSVSGES